jgi:predicted  nucleic acid-binding Zn-ribbon protein
MPFTASHTNQQISNSIGAMLLLNSSCQALIEVSIAPSASPWYPILDQELGHAENFVVGWRQNGYLYFQSEILEQIDACGKGFLAAQAPVDTLFRQIEQKFDPATRDRIVTAMTSLEKPVQGMLDAITAYSDKLSNFESAMAEPYAQMKQSIAQIQAQEANIQQQIAAINTQIAQLQQQVNTDREAISKAEAQRTAGIIETIFGVLLAPVTGGTSLILAGIGVGTIAEAQEKVSQLESTIAQYQTTIAGDQIELSSDQQQVATLNGLAMSVGVALNDIALITSALDALRVTWDVLLGELENAAGDIAKADNAQLAIVAHVWFDAVCDAWQDINGFVEAMMMQNRPTPRNVSIG